MKVVSLVTLVIGTLFSQPGLAATATVPTDYSTIQAAVTAVQGTAGAQVTVNSNATFVENIIATQSVWITAGAGYSPLIRPATGSAITLEPNATTDEAFVLTGLRVQGCGTGVNSIITLTNRNTAGTVYLNMTGVDIANPGCGASSTGLKIGRGVGAGAASMNRVAIEDSTMNIVNTTSGGAAIYMNDLPGRIFIASSAIGVTNAIALDVQGNGSGGPPANHIGVYVADSRFHVGSTGGASAMAINLSDNITSEILSNRFTFVDGSLAVDGINIVGTLLANTQTISQNTFSRASMGSGSGVRLAPRGDATYGHQSGTAIVSNNVMRNIESGISVNPQYSNDTAYLTAINNTVHNARRCLDLYAGDSTTINGRFSNNLCTSISGSTGSIGGVPVVFGAITAYERPGANITMSFANNGFYDNANGDYSPTVPGILNVGPVVTTNPIYANPLAGDLRLGTGSPAIDAGVTEAGVTVDHDGTSRPQAGAYDIGAFEGAFTVASAVKQVPSLGQFAIASLSLILAAMARALQRRSLDP